VEEGEEKGDDEGEDEGLRRGREGAKKVGHVVSGAREGEGRKRDARKEELLRSEGRTRRHS
jgi:hypothetical protein